nr:MAG TPA: hypothetical protein [Caudoviricetes sp.]
MVNHTLFPLYLSIHYLTFYHYTIPLYHSIPTTIPYYHISL